MSPKNAAVMGYRTNEGFKPIITWEGRRKQYAIIIAPPVRIIKLDKREQRYMNEVARKGGTYPVRRAARKFIASGRALGITKAAKLALKEILE